MEPKQNIQTLQRRAISFSLANKNINKNVTSYIQTAVSRLEMKDDTVISDEEEIQIDKIQQKKQYIKDFPNNMCIMDARQIMTSFDST